MQFIHRKFLILTLTLNVGIASANDIGGSDKDTGEVIRIPG
jgi:hypothetical protein